MDAIVRKIRNDLRLSMNGVVAASMRGKGLNFRMTFGVEIPKLRQIASKYEPDKVLAEMLWKEDVREMKILATMLYPPEQLTKETADRWAYNINNQELREQSCKNLFQRLTFADDLVEAWTKNVGENIRTTGFWLFARLCIIRSDAVRRIVADELLEHAVKDLGSDSLLLRQSALNALKFYGRIVPENAKYTLAKVSYFENSNTPMEKEMFDQLKFEFGIGD